MSTKRRSGLGRGFEALVGTKVTAAAEANHSNLRELPIEQIVRGRYQPRQTFTAESLQELADSIKAQGILQPIIVRQLEPQHYEIIAGERRWRAAQLAQLATVPVIIKNLSDSATAAVALIENIQREDLNALEQALALQRLITEFEFTHQQAAAAVGRSRVSVTNLLRLLELTAEVKAWLAEGKLEMGHARALLAVSGDQQIRLARQVMEKQLSVRATEKLVQQPQADTTSAASTGKTDPNILQLEQELADLINAKVAVQHQKSGSGKLIIHYNNLNELDGILGKIRPN